MPAGAYTQERVLEDWGPGYRRCPRCGNVFPANPGYFYARSNGTLELCQGNGTSNCRREYYRRYASLRRSTGTNRKFGVEIEFIGDPEDLCEAMRSVGLACDVEGYNHRTKSTWKIVPDSSVSDGAELVSPPLRGERGREQVRKACQALQSIGATVDSETGLHVHHEVKNLTLDQFKRLFRLWYVAQGQSEKLVSQSRREGNYCCNISSCDLSRIESLRDLDPQNVQNAMERYRTLSVWSAFPNYGTVEVRWHQGTTNADKILAWIEYVQAFITAAVGEYDIPDTFYTLADVFTALSDHGLSDSTAAFLTTRADVLSRVSDYTPRPRRCAECGEYRDECLCCSECSEYPCVCEDEDDWSGEDEESSECSCRVCVADRENRRVYA